VKLIDGEHGRRWVIDRGGQRLERDVDEDPKRKRRILVDGTLATECGERKQRAILERGGPP
jgi:hypothetical protein